MSQSHIPLPGIITWPATSATRVRGTPTCHRRRCTLDSRPRVQPSRFEAEQDVYSVRERQRFIAGCLNESQVRLAARHWEDYSHRPYYDVKYYMR
jgi:hypothetical protein